MWRGDRSAAARPVFDCWQGRRGALAANYTSWRCIFWLHFGRKAAACGNYKHTWVYQHVSSVKMRHLNLSKVQVQVEALIMTWLMMAPDNSRTTWPLGGGGGFPAFFFVLLTVCTCLLSSSSWALQNSCSMEQSSSLNNPTSSQFFKKRVGVGVWSENGMTGHFKIIYDAISLDRQHVVYKHAKHKPGSCITLFSHACSDKKCSVFKIMNVFLDFGFKTTKPPPCEKKTVHLRARFSWRRADSTFRGGGSRLVR